MPFDEPTKTRLEELLALIGSEAFDSEARQRLSDIVSESDEARRMYLEHCQMHAMLHQSTLLSAFHAEKPQIAATLESTKRRRSFYVLTGLAVAVSALFVVGVIGRQFFRQDSSFQATAPRIARVQNIEGAAWLGESMLARDTEVSSGLLRVESGSIDLRFDNGTILLVEGPAELLMESGMQVSLRRGRLAARVSEEARGFTVLGPESAVVDLGTEFAMAVEDDGSWVEVYDGEVDVALLNRDGQAWKSRELTASGPVRIDTLNGEIIDETSPIALPRLAEVLPDGLNVPIEYVNAVRKSAPVHYWRFEESEKGSAIDVVNDTTAAILGGTQVNDGGLYFPGGKKNHGLVFVAEPRPSLINGEFTLEVWASPSFTQKRGLIGFNHRFPDSISQESLYRLGTTGADTQTGTQGRAIFPSETFQFVGNLWPYDEAGVVRVFSASRYRVGGWNHIVAVRRDKQLEIYLNGEKTQAAPAPPLSSKPIPTTITIGNSYGPASEKRGSGRNHFKGLVDEVAIYDKALSADEVAEHYELMKVNDQ